MELDFTQPTPRIKTLEEAKKLIDVLWSLCAEIPTLKKRIEELEEKLNTNSNNSSKPPSSDRFKSNKKPKKKGKRSRGGQPGHAGITRNLLPKAEETVSEAIAAPVEEAKAYVKEQKIVNCDETSHAECGKKMWTWAAIANTVAVFMITTTRSAKAAKTLLGEEFRGILGSDRYSAYLWIAAIYRQVCWAHLQRDFKKIAERTGKSKMIGLRLLVYTRRMFHYWHQVRDGTLTRKRSVFKFFCDSMHAYLNEKKLLSLLPIKAPDQIIGANLPKAA